MYCVETIIKKRTILFEMGTLYFFANFNSSSVLSHNVPRIHEPENLNPQQGDRDAVRFVGLSAELTSMILHRADRAATRL